jgi:hypothetical protein
MSKSRTLSICLSDLPKERILKHSNGKMYLNLTTYDYDEPDQFGNHFSVSLPLLENQIKEKEKGEKIQRVFLGSGKIWGNTTQQINKEESDALGF